MAAKKAAKGDKYVQKGGVEFLGKKGKEATAKKPKGKK